MNALRVSRRITAAVIVQALSFLWLLGLSVALVVCFRAVTYLTEQVQATVASQQVLALEARVAELAGNVQALEVIPAASATALQAVQQTLQTQIAQLEERLTAFAGDMQALRVEMDDIKARQAAARAAPPAPRRPARPAVITPQPEPFPYRVLGIERRAGLRNVLVAPATGEVKADQIQVLLPGEMLGAWRLQAIEDSTAIFQSGEQIRRITIPGRSE